MIKFAESESRRSVLKHGANQYYTASHVTQKAEFYQIDVMQTKTVNGLNEKY